MQVDSHVKLKKQQKQQQQKMHAGAVAFVCQRRAQGAASLIFWFLESDNSSDRCDCCRR
jgi:hypothetical protein